MKQLSLILSLAVSLLILEGGLRALTTYPLTASSNKQDHSRLGYVLSSGLPDVDELGFRNRSGTLAKASLTLVGDSHVHGTGVALGDDFPSRLGELLGRDVYNMGVGSYGVYHYAVLLDDLLNSSSKEVLLGLYPSNDLVGHCSITTLDSWARFAETQRLSAPPCGGESEAVRMPKGLMSSAWVQLHNRVAFLNAIHHLLRRYRERSDQQFILPANNQVRWNRAAKHARATSLENTDRLIVFKDSLSILERAQRKFADKQIGFAVLLIPSKELVFHDWAVANDWPIEAEFKALLAPQKELMERYISFLTSRGIRFGDATQPMVVALDKTISMDRTLYRSGNDGHPNADGYKVYATVAADLLTADDR